MLRLFLNSLALRFLLLLSLLNFTSVIQGKMELPNTERRDSSGLISEIQVLMLKYIVLLMLKYIVGLSVHSFGLNLSWANRSSLFLS